MDSDGDRAHGVSGVTAPRHEWDVFISYARADNRPDATDPDGLGWVSAIKDAIEHDSREVEGRRLRVFMDTTDIHLFDDWRRRIVEALNSARALLVCLSPNYFNSQPCQWEWEEFLLRQARRESDGGGGAVTSVFFVELPDEGAEAIRRWREEVTRYQGVDLRPWFPSGARSLTRDTVAQRRIRQLGDTLAQRVREGELATGSLGNLKRRNPRFVGRRELLADLAHEVTAASGAGRVTVLHGPGGLGKTELAVQHAWANRQHYAGGVWQVAAEGRTDVTSALALLAGEDGIVGPDLVGADPATVGRAVLRSLMHRAEEVGPVLLILDNVSEVALLSEGSLGPVPESPHLTLVATSRLGPEDFGCPDRLGFVDVRPLTMMEGVALLNDLRSVDDRVHSADRGDPAVAELVELLGGFTLAIEQVGLYLAVQPELTPTDVISQLRTYGLTALDRQAQADEAIAANMRHESAVLSTVLRSTLDGLGKDEVVCEDARLVLHLAAQLPADAIPLSWLRQMLAEVRPASDQSSIEFPVGTWPRVLRTLLARRLLQSGADGEVVRMHRLHQAHLREMTPAADAVVIRDAVAQHLIRTAGRAAIDDSDTTLWECAALTDALLLWVPQDPGVAEAANSGRLFRRLAESVGDDRPLTLAQAIVKRCMQQYQQHPDSIEVTLDLARAWSSAGRLLRSWRPADAVAAYEQALVLAEQAQVSYDSVQTRRMLSVALNNLAAAVEFSEPDRARALFERDCAIAEALAGEYPGNLRLRVDYWLSLNSLGRAVEEVDSARALTLFERGLNIIEQLAADSPDDARLWRDLSLSLQNVARVCEVRDPGRARALYERDRELMLRRSSQRPDDLMALRDLSVTHLCLARSYMGSDRAAALRHIAQAVEIRESLHTRRPGSLAAARDLVVALNILGRVVEGGEHDLARTSYSRALDLALEVVDADPGSALAIRELAVCRSNLARMTWVHDQESAIELLELTCGGMEVVCERLPGNGRFERESRMLRESLDWCFRRWAGE